MTSAAPARDVAQQAGHRLARIWSAWALRRVARAPIQRMSLAVQYLLASLVVLLCALLILGVWVGNQIEAAVLSRTGAIAALYVGSAVAPFVQGIAREPRLYESELTGLDHLLSDTPLGERTVEFRVWSSEKTILYSADRSLIGQRLNPDTGYDEALAGGVTAELSDLPLAEHRDLRGWASQLLEVYAPVREDARGRVIGVIEFYQLPDELQDEIAAARQRSWAVVAAITLVTYLLLAGIVKRGSDTIARQQRTVQQQLSDQRQLAEDKARLYQEAQDALRVRGEFLSVASHELRTPVTALLAYTQLMRSRLKRGRLSRAEFGEVLDEVLKQSDRLARLGSQLLDTSRLEAGKLEIKREPTDVAKLVRATVETMTRERVIALEAPTELRAVVDPVRLEQLLGNLLDNALKFSSDDSPLEVKLDEARPGWLRLSVRDHGIGVPVEHRPRIFERFYQAHAGQHIAGVAGMGLGLYIGQQIVEMHGGQISAEFPASGGTCITVLLPTAEASDAHAGGGVPETQAARATV
jgi:signal transduction histidine kinase